MTYAFKVQRVTFSGTCYSGNEIWSTGLFLGSESADPGTVSQAQVDTIAGLWQTFFTAPNSSLSNQYACDQVKIALLGTDGKTDPLNVVYHTFSSALHGDNGLNAPLPQASLVATLTSALPRGMGSKGRMYLPGFAQLPNNTGHLDGTAIANIATTFQTFINGVNAAAASDQKVILASKGHLLPSVVVGVNKLVTGIKIGNVMDTQRRRRNGIVESYTAKTIP